MADEYWVLGAKEGLGRVYPWSTSSLGEIISGITFTIPGDSTIYSGFKQTTTSSMVTIQAYSENKVLTLAAGTPSASNGISFMKQTYRLITIKSIDTSVINGAYSWIKSSLGQGEKYDFAQSLENLNPSKYSQVLSNTNSTTTITAKAIGYASNSTTSNEWKKNG